MASIFATLYHDKLTKRLTDDNSILSKMKNMSPYLIDKGQILRIPSLTSVPTISKGSVGDRDTTTTDTTETEQVLTLEYYSTNVKRISNMEEYFSNYSKMEDLIDQYVRYIEDYITTDSLIKLATATDSARIIATTGSTGTANSPSGANKKMVKIEDIAKISMLMDIDKVSKENRFIVIHPNQAFELGYSADNITYNRRDYGKTGLVAGVIDNIAGVNVMVRAEIPVAYGSASSAGVVPIGTTNLASYVFNAVAFQSDNVGFAFSNPQTYLHENDVYKQATVVSFSALALADALRPSGSRFGLYGLRQG